MGVFWVYRLHGVDSVYKLRKVLGWEFPYMGDAL